MRVFRQFQGEVRSSRGLLGENFSGSCTVTSCNRLILSLASFVATFVCAQLISHEIHAEGSSATPLDQEIATLNFGEFIFHVLG